MSIKWNWNTATLNLTLQEYEAHIAQKPRLIIVEPLTTCRTTIDPFVDSIRCLETKQTECLSKPKTMSDAFVTALKCLAVKRSLESNVEESTLDEISKDKNRFQFLKPWRAWPCETSRSKRHAYSTGRLKNTAKTTGRRILREVLKLYAQPA